MYAEVLVQYGNKALDHTFTYIIPDNLKDELKIGMKVSVPFGTKSINGFVINIKSDYNEEFELKQIKEIVTKELKLNNELLELGKYIKDKTLCSLISAYQTMLPTSLKVNNSKENYEKYLTYIELNKSISIIDEYISKCKYPKQISILEELKLDKVLKKDLDVSALNTLKKHGLVKETKESIYRINPDNKRKRKYKLTDEQQDVFNQIKDNFNESNTYLLHGVTGSGKTEIYMHLIDECIKSKKKAIMLVPEISLTHQIINRFYERFGKDVAIFHSRLSDGEKYDEYKKIERGEVSIVVGTRSAIFAPLDNIGIIILDEENTSSYKQENNPRYHALDVAKWRSEYHKCPLVLGSATPTYETMARALKGVYTYLKLDNRIGNAKMPKIKIINMQDEYKKRNMILSEELQIKIMEKLERHEQVMLLLNRRGYSTIVTCKSCGYTFKCPHCDITLTYHKTNNHLVCHYCGFTTFKTEECPECKEKAITTYGLGTEKLESFLHELYPSYNIVRMDLDTTTKKGSHNKIIKDIENQKYDIVVGTQMISKGFDFPNVTLVGIINADESLNIPDFRSGENTYSLLSQVAGRAGRSDKSGEVIIQTFNPEVKTLSYILNNDYMGNYNYEMDIRRKLKYPPYYYLIGIKITSKDYKEASSNATKIVNYLRSHIDDKSIVLGPTTAPLFKLNNVYRFQIIIKYRFDKELFNTLKYLDSEYANNTKVNFEIDVDPIRI